MTSRGWLAAAAGVLAGLSVAAPVSAAKTINLNPAHRNHTAAGFGTKQCTGPLAGHPSVDGRHFVLPASAADDFVSVTLTFSRPGGNVTVGPITSENPAMPTMGDGWSGFLDNAGRANDDKHAYVFTQPGWTLLDGTAQVEPNTASGTFNLSHTCPAVQAQPSRSTTLSPTSAPSPANTPPPKIAHSPGGPSPLGGDPKAIGGGPKPIGGAKTGGGGMSGGWFGTAAAFLVSLGLVGYLLHRRRRDM
ncbi:hypothetical protein [Allorhizocola rhizosphaerae]|uniref:hypothetical protein n=1 Tax=Allorhizocola rhizosphaerae TaxID=1872709 RepID=UPI0013C2D5E6|nr:hypothetical protein [Allorhizocola rhizosphaerae]